MARKKKSVFFRKSGGDGGLFRILAVLVVLSAIGGAGLYAYRHGAGRVLQLAASSPETAAKALEDARGLLAGGNPDAAHTALNPALRARQPRVAGPAVLCLADILNAQGKPAEAVAALEKGMDDLAATPEYPVLVARLAFEHERAGRKEEAGALYGQLRENAPPEMQAMALCGLGRMKEAEGDLTGARDLFRDAAERAPWDSPAWNEALGPLGRLNVQLIFTPGETPESKVYTVERGDTLISIGIKLNTTQALLMRANNLSDGQTLSPGQRLKYTPKDFHLVIERSTCRIFLLDSRGVFKMYRTGLGMPGHETTPGKYIIGVKEKDPVWHKQGAGPIPAGDPANELGTRWMPLVPQEPNLPKDLGIHGTIAPDSVGQFSSHGCARMLNEEVEELWDLVVRSTPVAIVEKYTPGMPLEPGAGDAQGVPAESPPAEAPAAA